MAFDAKKAAADIGDWLRQNFFAEHCKLFQSRPFIWQIWDGNPNGFSALVNYHKLAAPKGQGRKTLELLTYTYLGDWIDRQKLDQAEGINGADDRLAAALDLQGQLKKILDGEPPYDIFVRWKPLHQQAIGWDPDINDGVRLNIRPFLNAQLRKGGKAGAGILRAKPGTIKWAKDRGKEPMRAKDEFPGSGAGTRTTPTCPLISAHRLQGLHLLATASMATAGTTCTTPVQQKKQHGHGIGGTADACGSAAIPSPTLLRCPTGSGMTTRP